MHCTALFILILLCLRLQCPSNRNSSQVLLRNLCFTGERHHSPSEWVPHHSLWYAVVLTQMTIALKRHGVRLGYRCTPGTYVSGITCQVIIITCWLKFCTNNQQIFRAEMQPVCSAPTYAGRNCTVIKYVLGKIFNKKTYLHAKTFG